jgi:hypothetical protein
VTDTWESSPLVEEVWESSTTAGVEWRTVYSEPSAVASVNGETGVVELDAADIPVDAASIQTALQVVFPEATFTAEEIETALLQYGFGINFALAQAAAGIAAAAEVADNSVPRTSAPLFLSDYAPEGGTDSASAGLKDALDALAAQGGGELIVDGLFLLDTATAVVNFSGAANSVTIRGYGSRSAFFCRGGVNNVCLQISGLDTLMIENVVFFGSQSTLPDCRNAVYLTECRTATLHGCTFIGLVAGGSSGSINGAVLRSHASNLVLRSTNFIACGGQIASWHGGADVPVVLSSSSNGLTVEDCRFHDVIHGAHFRGTAQAFKRQPIAWVWVREPQMVSGAWAPTQSRALSFKNCQFDEATASAIRVENTINSDRHRLVTIENCNIASPSTSTVPYALAAPLLVNGVDTVLVRDTAVGYFATATTAMQFEDCAVVTVDGVHGFSPSTTIVADEDCDTFLYRNLRGSITTVDSDAATTIDLDAVYTGGGGGAVDSVNGLTGTVVLDAAKVAASPRRPAVLATAADYSLQANYGTPAARMDLTTTATVAALAGYAYLAYGDRVTTADLSRLMFEITATSLTAGQAVNVVCYEQAANGLPGELAWSESVTVGTTVGIIGHNVGAGVRLPDNGYFIGMHNPVGNSGTVTFRVGRPVDAPFGGLGASVTLWSGVVAQPGATPAADMSGFTLNSAANTATRLGPNQTAPIVLVR